MPRIGLSALSFAGVVAGVLAAGASVRADVKLPSVIGDHMVLQQEIGAPIWGEADAGEKVTVAFADQKQSATADDKGHWAVKLAALKASDQPADLTVSGKNTVTLHDVLVGEVWLCSGQSNMSFNLQSAQCQGRNCQGGVPRHPPVYRSQLDPVRAAA